MAEFQQVDNKLLDLSSNDHNDIVIALTPIHYDWFKLGGFLKISKGTLKGIAGKHNNDHFRQMSDLIGTWISRPTKEHRPSWRVLCQALADMGERELAYKIAGIEEDDQSTSKSAISAATGGIAVSRIAPTVEDLQEQLYNLTAWELFATRLPKIDQHDVARITRDFRGAEQQKLELYTVWLDKCANASWDHVIDALEKNRLHRLVADIKQWLKTNRGKVVSTDNGHVPPQPSNRQANGLEGPTDSGHLPEPDILENTDGDPSPDDDDTPVCPITLNDGVNREFIPKGTVTWNSKGDSAKAGSGNQQCHLVVVITNEYIFTTGRLIGIEEDRQQLYKTFGGEEIFRLVKLKDTRKEEMEEVLSNIMDHFQLPVEKQYKSVFIIFSGHGCMSKGQKKSFIISEDCQHVSLDNLIDSFEKKIGNAVPKFFLIDACRCVSKDTPKGFGRAKVNSLYAYATQKGERAWMNKETGSYWIQEVARLLRQEKNSPVSKIIKKANKNVSEKTTQNPQMNDQFLKDNGKELCLKIIDYEQKKDSIVPGGIRARHGKDGTDTTPAVDHAKSSDPGTTSEETLAPPTDKPTSKKLPSVSDSFGTIKNILIGVLLVIIVYIICNR